MLSGSGENAHLCRSLRVTEVPSREFAVICTRLGAHAVVGVVDNCNRVVLHAGPGQHLVAFSRTGRKPAEDLPERMSQWNSPLLLQLLGSGCCKQHAGDGLRNSALLLREYLSGFTVVIEAGLCLFRKRHFPAVVIAS